MRPVHYVCAAVALPGLMMLVSCSGERPGSALDPAGPRAEAVEPHWQTMLWLGWAVWLLVTVGVVVALVRRRRRREQRGEEQGSDRRTTLFVVLAGAVVPGVVVAFLTFQAIGVLQQTDPSSLDEELVVEVTGHRYWWEVHYPEADITTANEIHVPAGQRVKLEVTSSDVIHSIWAPRLGGKIDLIPGRSNTTWLAADEPGEYWGQCAEFCGIQHAKMRFLVVAHEPEEYERWIARQQLPAVTPLAREEDDLVARGQQVFLSSSCVYCHTVDGTAAAGKLGPDLTHLAGRRTIGAGILPNEPGHLAGWILDPQSIKPGNQMPGTDLDGDELQALLAYLQSLE